MQCIKNLTLYMFVVVSLLAMNAFGSCTKTVVAAKEEGKLPDNNALIKKYTAQYTTYYDSVISDSKLTFQQKTNKITKKSKAIESSIRKQLYNLYNHHSVSGKTCVTCTKASDGGSKKCGPNCVVPPSPEYRLHLDSRWMDFGPQTNSQPEAIGESMCVQLKISGKGKKKRHFGGKYLLKKDTIKLKVYEDLEEIMLGIKDSRV